MGVDNALLLRRILTHKISDQAFSQNTFLFVAQTVVRRSGPNKVDVKARKDSIGLSESSSK